MATQAKGKSALGFRIRTITAGFDLRESDWLAQLRSTSDFLDHARRGFEADGYEVQTTRIATQELADLVADRGRQATSDLLIEIDHFVSSKEVLVAVGSLLPPGQGDGFADWAAELMAQTRNLSFSLQIAAPGSEPDREIARVAAETILALSRLGGKGEQNFRFAAAARVPPGTPFFPVAYHGGPPSFSLGLESAGVVTEAFSEDAKSGGSSLARLLEHRLGPVVEIGGRIAGGSGFRFGGVDLSPAPGLDASIAAAIEAATGVPFGSPSTLTACAAVTTALAATNLPVCGYSGLMLPVLEDRVLAARAMEGHYDLADLLLFSSVCGTGLDVLPLPGDIAVPTLARILDDVATMASKLNKPLAARLLPIPGKKAGEIAEFDNPHLVDSAMVMAVDRDRDESAQGGR